MTEVEKLAHKLSAAGPDEFPFGYYLYLAEQLIAEGLPKEPKLAQADDD